jgi:exopolyphosphatase/guanosine-5'-triphosphate,3'-diphosphate pyrophosphatase
VRSAENGAEFVERVRQDAGIEVRTLTGDQEAELTFQGVIADEMLADRRLLAVDVGGGAMELVLGSSEGIEARLSLDLGGARLAQRFLTSDPVAPQEMEQLRSFVREVLSAVISTASTQGRLVVATGGTARALAAMDLLETGGSADAVHGYVLSAPRVNVLLDQLARMPRAERRRVPGLPSARADIIVAGTAIFATLMDTLGIDRMVISARGLRYGALALLAREK